MGKRALCALEHRQRMIDLARAGGSPEGVGPEVRAFGADHSKLGEAGRTLCRPTSEGKTVSRRRIGNEAGGCDVKSAARAKSERFYNEQRPGSPRRPASKKSSDSDVVCPHSLAGEPVDVTLSFLPLAHAG